VKNKLFLNPLGAKPAIHRRTPYASSETSASGNRRFAGCNTIPLNSNNFFIGFQEIAMNSPVMAHINVSVV
jgi:hypothetical protein